MTQQWAVCVENGVYQPLVYHLVVNLSAQQKVKAALWNSQVTCEVLLDNHQVLHWMIVSEQVYDEALQTGS